MKVIGKMVMFFEETRKLQSESNLEHKRQIHLKRCLKDVPSINFRSRVNGQEALFHNGEVALEKCSDCPNSSQPMSRGV